MTTAPSPPTAPAVSPEERAAADAHLARLIAFPTVSADSNLELIDYVEAALAPLGARAARSRSADGAKANLFSTIGPETDGGVVLSGHTDVVPAGDSGWSGDPFEAVWRGDRVYGRGACDMKGFLACMLAMAPRFAAAALARPLHLAFTYDEEVGCMGAQVLLEALAASGRRPAVCLIGEPTEMRVVEGHKGCFEYATCFHGAPGHGSDPESGLNAIHYASGFVAALLDVAEELRARPRGAPGPEGLPPFSPPWTTLQVGRIAGGVARNVIAERCEVDWELRPVSAEDAAFARAALFDKAATLDAEMRARRPDSGVRTETIAEIAGLAPVEDGAARALALALTGGRETDVVSFGTEAGLFQERGISTVVCGPGSIAQAHKADEYVSRAQLDACLDMIAGLVPKLAAPA